jgi:C1A family cysteine protease
MFSKQLLVFFALAASALAANTRPIEFYEKEFFEHMQKFNLKFTNGAEFIKRLSIFANTLDVIEAHNADATQTYKMGVNQFTHLTLDEFAAVNNLGVKMPNLRKNLSGPAHVAKDAATLPASVDWRASGAVTAVKNQGNCGSCWSFSATGAMESAYFLKFGTLPSFSEQQLVSCDKSGQDAGCNGGWMDDAFDYVKNNGGICSEGDYAYTSGTTGKDGTCATSCKNVENSQVASHSPAGSARDGTATVDELASAVAQQPVSIAIQANQLAFQTYKSGVLTGTCGQKLDHGVLAVGYGNEGGVDYWLVKNSWGPTWGEEGYIKIEKSSADKCGVLDAASYPNY